MAFKKTFVSLLLCLTMCCTALAACGNGGEESDTASGTASASSEVVTDAFPYQGDFGGQTVRILTVDTERHLYGVQ